ncbi:6-phosphogluconolactonase [uncultured Alteromonas sp.]|jgi:6-phosphogluconolactonase/glucosamine-6-phosphate isomerase/deaminase|uniref:6-phosphogluconolactonase n=1 Tax=uncultured Alteromonas sp. TaxID=179113 RepID=UPI0025E07FD7|nr:6-phosphogluconolactonase [uncultured Alteromonas sp.]
MTTASTLFKRDEKNGNVWLEKTESGTVEYIDKGLQPQVMQSEAAVGHAMLDELIAVAESKKGDINIALLGGRGAQQLHKLLGEKATTSELDDILSRLNVFTQDALAPMAMGNSLSFVRDFERILGDSFFQKIKSFTPMQTDTADLEAALTRYLEKLEQLGGLDIFFIGHGPEADEASHLAYIKPFSGAKAVHMAGLIPISSSILEHHISKFKAGGSDISPTDESQCRAAKFILTLGPAAILSAEKIVQSVVDAETAPAKVKTYAKVLNTPISQDSAIAEQQLDANPGLWIRLHDNVKSFVLPNVMI